jgi:hypothetical protein
MYTYKNIKTGETKKAISALSFVLADEFFGTTYWYLGSNWETIQIL